MTQLPDSYSYCHRSSKQLHFVTQVDKHYWPKLITDWIQVFPKISKVSPPSLPSCPTLGLSLDSQVVVALNTYWASTALMSRSKYKPIWSFVHKQNISSSAVWKMTYHFILVFILGRQLGEKRAMSYWHLVITVIYIKLKPECAHWLQINWTYRFRQD